jgi:glycosyltransferase involved in cell wall biosynthesis
MGGAQRCLLELFPAERSSGWEAHAALPGDGPLVRLLGERGVLVHRLSLSNYSLGGKGVTDLGRFLRDLPIVEAEIRTLVNQLRPAVVYVNGPRLMPAVARAVHGCRVVFHSHNTPRALTGKWLVESALDCTRASIIAASRHIAEHWSRPARVIYGGVTGPPQGWSRLPEGTGPRVGLIGRFAPLKGQKEFVLAARMLHRELPGARFALCGDVLFGDARAERFRKEVLQDLPPNVEHAGWCDDVYGVLRGIDLLVIPSGREGGIPTVALEAFSARVPVLSTPAGGTAEVLRDGENGFLLASREPAAIAERLRDLLPRRDLLDDAAEAAYRQWEANLTASRYRAEVWDLILRGEGS